MKVPDKVIVNYQNTITYGAIFAAIISYNQWHSFWWMVLHSLLSWFYIIYWTIFY